LPVRSDLGLVRHAEIAGFLRFAGLLGFLRLLKLVLRFAGFLRPEFARLVAPGFTEFARFLRLAGFPRFLPPGFAIFIASRLARGIPPKIARLLAPGAHIPLELPQGAAQGFNFAFVRQLLAVGQFHQLQHLVHLLEGLAQGRHHFGDFFDGLADGGGRRRLE
jgi:hypothetical protein